MRTLIAKSAGLLAAVLFFSSFAPLPGGEGFEVFLNNKLVLQRYGKSLDEVQTIRLSEGSPQDVLTVKYYHCGKVGRNRELTIKDGNNKTLKTIHFEDVKMERGAMSCRVKEIISLKKGTHSVLKLYYSSSELPGGRLLASLVTDKGSTASLQP